MRILVVDDDCVTVDFLTDVLGEMGHEVRDATDGMEALDALDRSPTDLIISDIRMPRLDGIGLLEAVAKRLDPPEVVLLTGYGEMETAIQALNLGAKDYLHKPITASELDSRISRIADELALRRQLETARIEQARAETVRQMVVTLSHELNNPMTSILGNLRVLKQAEQEGEELADAAHLYECIERNCQRMQDVLERLRRIEKVSSTEYLPGTTMIDTMASHYTKDER
jgi:DNA-binding response OmpR family regulator